MHEEANGVKRFNETLGLFLGLHEGKKGNKGKEVDPQHVFYVFDLVSRTVEQGEGRRRHRKTRPSKYWISYSFIHQFNK